MRADTTKTDSSVWPRVKLGEVCEEIRDRVQSAKVPVDCYVTTDNMLQNCAGIVRAEYVPKDVGLVRYQGGDVLLANIRPYLRKLWLSNRDGGCSSDVIVFRSACQGLSPDYLFAALSQDRFFDYVMKKPRGTKMPRGDRDWMKQFEFPLPPLPVQHSIVERLERELGAVDKLATKFEELETAAEAEFKAELKETFEGFEGACGGRGATALPAHGRARAPREPQASAVCRVKLGEVCEILDSMRVPITKKDRKAGPYPYYGASGIVDYVAEWLFDERLVLLGEDGAKWGAGDMSAFIIEGKTWVNNHAHVLRPSNNVYDCFLVYYLNFADLSESITGVTVPKLNQQKMCEISIPLPPLPVQRSIVSQLDAAKAKKEALVAAAKRGREAAALWRKAILKEAFE